MLCEDRGIFLEIADFIKGLGLTILRGVMEARKNKIWARFTVEVSSSMHYEGSLGWPRTQKARIASPQSMLFHD
jgi:hypothetical protein